MKKVLSKTFENYQINQTFPGKKIYIRGGESMKNLLRNMVVGGLCLSLSLGNICCPVSGVARAESKKENNKTEYIVTMNSEKVYEKISCEFSNGVTRTESKYESNLQDENIKVLELTEKQYEEAEQTKGVVSIEENIAISASKVETKGNQNRKEKVEQKEKSNNENWNLKMINAEQSDSDTKSEKAKGIKIAIIDSGVNFIDDVNVTERYNLVPGEDDMMPLYEDFTGHGTAIAGVIAGKESGNKETRGINSKAELYSIKVFDQSNQAPLSRIIEAIYLAIEKDVDIINLSFGTTEYSKALEKAVNDAWNNGILIVAAAGNRGETDGKVEYPAAFENVMSVGSTDTCADVSEFCSTCGKIDVMAPGESITSTAFLDGTITSSGTSMAVPHVVGVASVLWELDADKPAEFIRSLIEASANRNTKDGYGIVDLDYACEIYDDFAQEFEQESDKGENNKNTGDKYQNSYIDKYDNDNEIEIFADIDKAEASWGKNAHMEAVQEAGVKDCKGNNYTTQALNLIKVGIRINDQNSYLKTISSDKSKHRWWHASKDQKKDVVFNYIASALFMNNLIKTTNCDLNKVSKPAGMSQYAFKNMKSELNNAITQNNDYQINKQIKNLGYSANDKTRRYVYWGMLMHILTDAYAHRTYEKVDGDWVKIKDDKTDDTSYKVKRYKSAKEVVKNIMKNRINVSEPASSKQISFSDLALSEEFYNGNFRLQNLKEYGKESGIVVEIYFSSYPVIAQITLTKNYLTKAQIDSKY